MARHRGGCGERGVSETKCRAKSTAGEGENTRRDRFACAPLGALSLAHFLSLEFVVHPQIEIRHVPDSNLLLEGVLKDEERSVMGTRAGIEGTSGNTEANSVLRCVFLSCSFDLLMCNPPFFSSLDSTGVNPSRSAAATPSELVCPGGEERFVAQMITQSKTRPMQIRSARKQKKTRRRVAR